MNREEHKKHESLVFDCPFCRAKADAYEGVIHARNMAESMAKDLVLLVKTLSAFADKIEE